MPKEIESTYLIKKLPDDLKKNNFVLIKQGYFSDEKNSLRIRKENNRYLLTKKELIKPNDFSQFVETSISLTKREFDRLWKLVIKSLTKKRYYHQLPDNLSLELDVFQGKLKGLIVGEIEFKNRKAQKEFRKPKWFGKDITQERWVSGESLSSKSFQKIKKYLSLKV